MEKRRELRDIGKIHLSGDHLSLYIGLLMGHTHQTQIKCFAREDFIQSHSAKT